MWEGELTFTLCHVFYAQANKTVSGGRERGPRRTDRGSRRAKTREKTTQGMSERWFIGCVIPHRGFRVHATYVSSFWPPLEFGVPNRRVNASNIAHGERRDRKEKESQSTKTITLNFESNNNSRSIFASWGTNAGKTLALFHVCMHILRPFDWGF